MKSHLIYPKEKFEEELNSYITYGLEIIKRSQQKDIETANFEKCEYDFSLFKDEVSEFLKQRFDNPNNEYLKEFLEAGKMNTESMTAALSGENPSSYNFRFRFFGKKSASKLQVLVNLSNKLKFIPTKNPVYIETNNEEIMSQKKIFISHSSSDKELVEKVIDILEIIGVSSNNIFCSSFEGYGVRLGSNFLDVIKEQLNSNVLVLFLLSSNFYSSVVSLCEMGATWVKTNQQIPILIPPFDYKDIQGVIPNTHGMKINEKEKYNTLKEIVEGFLELNPINGNVWERKRDNILIEIKKVLDNNNPSKFAEMMSENSTTVDIDFYENADVKIKELSKKEWPDNFEMQLDYIERQKDAIEKLKKHNPIDIESNDFKKIREKGRLEWENNFEMQLDHEQRQVESYRRLKKM